MNQYFPDRTIIVFDDSLNSYCPKTLEWKNFLPTPTRNDVSAFISLLPTIKTKLQLPSSYDSCPGSQGGLQHSPVVHKLPLIRHPIQLRSDEEAFPKSEKKHLDLLQHREEVE